jgi:DNA-binding transcriptional regulator YiaG
MPNVGEVLKGEISRLSKKVVRQHMKPVQSATTAHRKQLGSLKKQVQLLEREIALLRRTAGKNVPVAEAEEEGVKHRFSAKGLTTLRNRLGLSGEEFGRLVNVSAQTVYNWESDKTYPRATQVSAIAGLRKIGKKEARARLETAETPQ